MMRFFAAVLGVVAVSHAGAWGQVEAPPRADEAAARAFAHMVKTHREWPSVTIKATLKIALTQDGAEASGDEVKADFTRTRDGAGVIHVGGFTMHINDGVLSVIHESNEDEYFKSEIADSPYTTILWDGFGSFDRIPFPHLAVLWGADPMDELYMEFYADTPELVPTGLADRVLEGRTVRTIEMSGPEGTMEINLDPRTEQILSINQTITNSWLLHAGVIRTNTYEFEYETFDEPLPEDRVAFVKGDRQRVGLMESLIKRDPVIGQPGMPPDGPLVGRAAPDFLLQTPDGDVVDLANLRGEVVVLDFWAVWCGFCRAALPELHRVADWARNEQLPVRVFAVNTLENGDTLEAKIKVATDFWKQAGHTLPILMDHDNATAEAYSVGGIPTTFVIGPDGVVVGHHEGFGPNYADELKEDIRRALDN